MPTSINFMWEQFAWYKIDNICGMSPWVFYTVGFNGCSFSMKSFDELLKTEIPWYDGTKLQHIVNNEWTIEWQDIIK